MNFFYTVCYAITSNKGGISLLFIKKVTLYGEFLFCPLRNTFEFTILLNNGTIFSYKGYAETPNFFMSGCAGLKKGYFIKHYSKNLLKYPYLDIKMYKETQMLVFTLI